MRVIITGGPGGRQNEQRMADAVEQAIVCLDLDPLFHIAAGANRADHFAFKAAQRHGMISDHYFSQVSAEVRLDQARADRNARMVAHADAAIVCHDPGLCPDVDDLVARIRAANIPLWIG